MIKNIQELPSRYEPLVTTLGDKAKSTFVKQDEDTNTVKTLIAQMRSSGQSKLMFVFNPSQSGAGKTTFIHSLEIFLADQISSVLRLPEAHSIDIMQIPKFIGAIPRSDKTTVINFDGHESWHYKEDEYRSLLVQLNALLRNRNDILILWPVNDKTFADEIVSTQKKIGGMSAFGMYPVYVMKGLTKEQFRPVLGKTRLNTGK